MDRSEIQFTLADLVCAMLLLSALIGTLATHADHAHYIWYYLPVLLFCEVAGFLISYRIFRQQRARRNAVTAVWTTAIGSLIGIVLPIVVLTTMSVALPMYLSVVLCHVYYFIVNNFGKRRLTSMQSPAEIAKLRARILENSRKSDLPDESAPQTSE